MLSVCIVTSGQPSVNPRVVKEAIALNAAGYKVTVIYNFWVQWADAGDTTIINENPDITWQRVGGHPISNKYYFLFTRIRLKLYKLPARWFDKTVYWKERATARCYHELKNAAINNKANLYIAHNIAALAPAAHAAKKNNAKYAFDAEDYHRGEVLNDAAFYNKVKLIEDSYLPRAAYLSAASPLIAERYALHYPTTHPVIINNVFSKKMLAKEITGYTKGDVLKLFWFSQTVGKDRGLEEIIKAMGLLQSSFIRVSILGSRTDSIAQYFNKLIADNHLDPVQLEFIDPVIPDEIFKVAHSHHIGLALERNDTPNRNICLTNKIFTYLLSGLAIVASDTDAQKNMLDTYPGIGEYYHIGDPVSLANIIRKYMDEPELLHNHQENALELAAHKLNWETEQEVLLATVGHLFDAE
jgi:glycosyltransferase involved in cell wall biosynthesis